MRRAAATETPEAQEGGGGAPKRSVSDRWTPVLVKRGYVAIARTFLRNYTRLQPPITHGEAMFLVHVLEYKWDRAAPFPGYKTIATFMGITPKQARRLAKSLEEKRYVRRELREAQTNRFHVDGLYAALEKLVEEGKARLSEIALNAPQ